MGHSATLNVLINNRRVGELTRDASGAIHFTYNRDWLDWEFAMPVSLSMPLRTQRYSGDSVTSVLSNLLPDDGKVRQRLAECVGVRGTTTFDLLSAIGRDCVGALQFLPVDEAEPGQLSEPPGRAVSDEQIELLLRDLNRTPLGVGQSGGFRISLAGASDKTALLHSDGAWYVPLAPASTTHIIKPQIGKLWGGNLVFSDSVENEYLCLRILATMGLRVADAEIIDFGSTRALAVQRFDREWVSDGRLLSIPQEDFCQVFSVPPNHKYESEGGPGMVPILERLQGSDTPQDDQIQFMKASYAFWLLGATDGHAKNFSITILPGGSFRLTPFYDVISAQPHLDAKQLSRKDFRLAMAVGNSRHYRIFDICDRHFIETGERAGLAPDAVSTVIEEVKDTTAGAIDQVMSELPPDFPEALVNSVTGGMRRRLG